jgi:Protein of unknown function DUF262/HNH endonuclease
MMRFSLAAGLYANNPCGRQLQLVLFKFQEKSFNAYQIHRPTPYFSSSSSALHAYAGDNDPYEKTLAELESKKLYGVAPKPYEIEHLANMVKKGRLDLAPNYQRKYVWKEDKASRLVVTVLLNRFVPGVVLHEKTKGKFDVVDGKQRLTTLMSFYMASEYPPTYQTVIREKMGKPFDSLIKLDENYDSLVGLKFDDLSEDRKNAYRAFSIPCTIIPYDTPKHEVFSVYEDINSGGEDLNAQELRRAVYWGKYIGLLDQLVLNKDFQAIRDKEVCPKDTDRELVLRAFAWRRNHAKYTRPLKSFLNAELQHYDDLCVGGAGKGSNPRGDKYLEEITVEFQWVMKVARTVFENGAFRTQKSNGTWNSTISVGLWDTLYLVLCELKLTYPSEAVYIRNKSALCGAIEKVTDEGNVDFSGSVSVRKFMERKNALHGALLSVLDRDGCNPGTTPRSFSGPDQLKTQLFDRQNGFCTICNESMDQSRLMDGSYVQLDHIHPYSKGGPSTADNAALVHAACNRFKGAKLNN